MTDKLNFKALCDLTTRVMGLEKDSLARKTRKREVQLARASACYIALTEENISRKVIADVLNRDRTATYHYQASHKKRLNKCDKYRDAFTKIFKAYKDIDGEKDIFVSKRHMKNYLLKNKVVESKNSDVKLEVVSGEVSCIIDTTYFDFSNQIVNISKALQDNYHYTVNII
jgi:hypothetical protein